jgi:plasmid stabilization system protein ParE
MSFSVELTAPAFIDLERLDTWLTARDPRAAIEASHLLEEAIYSLSAHPLRGRPVDETLRELTVRFGRDGYIIRYKVISKRVMIARIWHSLEQR